MIGASITNLVTEQPLKLCKDCWNLSSAVGNDKLLFGTCDAPDNLKPNYVCGGKVRLFSPQYLRENEKLCGPDARWFIPIQEAA